MRKFTKTILTSAAALMLAVTAVGCSDDGSRNESNSSVSASSSQPDTMNAEYIRKEIVGEWGRLDEAMHYFNADGSCIIGGMQGTYEIADDKSLITYTMSGSKTIYEWAESYSKATSDNYWYFTGDTFSVNSNAFTKLSDNEYNYDETPDMP